MLNAAGSPPSDGGALRLVSLCPSITESLVEMGLRESLVGITRYCIHPKGAFAGIERVGGTKNPDLGRIEALRPDLVFMNAEENRAADVEALSRRFAVDVSHPKKVADVPPMLRRFGARTGREGPAEAWARRIEESLAGLRTGFDAPFRYAYLIWKAPYMTVNDETYVADLLRRVGGENVFGNRPEAYPTVTLEEIVAAAPDALLLPDEPYRFRAADGAAFRERLPGAAVELLSGDDFCWHGARTLRGMEAARELSRRVAPALARR